MQLEVRCPDFFEKAITWGKESFPLLISIIKRIDT